MIVTQLHNLIAKMNSTEKGSITIKFGYDCRQLILVPGISFKIDNQDHSNVVIKFPEGHSILIPVNKICSIEYDL